MHLSMLRTWVLVLLAATPIAGLPRRARDLRGAGRLRSIKRQDANACEALFELNSQQVFQAADVAACTATIPFNSSVASQFLQYYRDTLAFQSTVAYLKNPPESYQQPSTDLFDGLDLIQRAVSAGSFTNQYDFESAVLRLVQSAHDAHLQLSIGVSGIFSFGSEFAISSVSTDGVQLPRPYFTTDLLNTQAGGVEPSAIVEINGQDAVEWFTQFAANNSQGLIDPHADWNALMETPAGDIQLIPSVFNGGTLINPGDNLDFKLENGTTVSSSWLTLINIPPLTPALSTGEDVYELFALGQFPNDTDLSSLGGSATPSATLDAADSPATTDGSSAAATTVAPVPSSSPTNWQGVAQVQAYPDDPFIVQPSLGDGGVLTGYFLGDDPDIAVLSIPSFEASDVAVSSFSNTIGEFLEQSKSAGKKKIVVDVQQNYGGNALLAVDAFKQFFPNIDPFTGSRMRSSSFSNALGLTFTQFLSDNKDTLNQSWIAEITDLPWAVLDFTDALTGRAFTSWPEFFGPHSVNNDFFSTQQRDNLSDILFDEFATGGADPETLQPLGITIYGFGNRSNVSPQPYAATDILILTDGICHSSCATFVEMMHHEAGVRTVAVGGRPNIGPMQAVGGSRGALLYDTRSLDGDIQLASTLNGSSKRDLPDSHLNVLELSVADASVNLRDQVRKAEDTPLQFTYEAANCRIYWTMETFNNFSALWAYAADAIWGDGRKCVKESTNFDSGNQTNTKGPDANQLQSWGGYGSPSVPPILPAGVVAPEPAFVGQLPNGTLVVPAVPGAARVLPAAVPLDNSTSGLDVNLDAEQDYDSVDSRLTGLPSDRFNKKCSSTEYCDFRAEECLPTSICSNGQFLPPVGICKRRCSGNADCQSSLRPTLVCNHHEFSCETGARGLSCGFIQELFRGSVGQTSLKRGQSKLVPVSVGFCEPLIQPDPGCRQRQGVNPQNAGFFVPVGQQPEVVDVPLDPASIPVN